MTEREKKRPWYNLRNLLGAFVVLYIIGSIFGEPEGESTSAASVMTHSEIIYAADDHFETSGFRMEDYLVTEMDGVELYLFLINNLQGAWCVATVIPGSTFEVLNADCEMGLWKYNEFYNLARQIE